MNAHICYLILEEWKALESGWRLAAMLVFHRAQGEPCIRADLCAPGLAGCRFALVSMTDRTFPPSEWTRQICSPLVVSFLQTRCQAASSGESAFLEHHLFGQDRPVRLFISLKLPGQSIFEELLFSKFFFFFAPSNILFKRKWDVYLLFPYFFSGKQRVVDFLPLPSLPSFFPKVLIWEKENEVLFLFSFLSHSKHCPCKFFKFPAICTQEAEREGERQRDKGSGKPRGRLQPLRLRSW